MSINENEEIKNLKSLLLFPQSNFDEIEIQNRLRDCYVKLLNRLQADTDMSPILAELRAFALAQIDALPEFFDALNLKIRPVEVRYHSCIITDEEVEFVAKTMHEKWLASLNLLEFGDEQNEDQRSFNLLSHSRQRFYREIFYCFPVALKQVDLELVKPGELNYFKPEISDSIARALHERYRLLMRNSEKDTDIQNALKASYLLDVVYYKDDFDSLPPEIQNANFDSAYHIPTKLLAIGYIMEQASRDIEPNLLMLDDADIETMAKLEHERWSWEKRLSGFVYGSVKTATTHHCLKPYNELSEFEKNKDRDQVKLYPLIIRDLDYIVRPICLTPHDEISYVYRKPSEIEKCILILEKQSNDIVNLLQTGEKNADDYSLMLKEVEKQLKRAVYGFNEVRDSIRQSEYVQRSILASRLFFRTCFPDSFLLFKPLDIVSGDFYFVSQLGEYKIVATADCTGHGISASLLTMVCCNYLDNAVNVYKLCDPAEILRFLFPRLEEFLSRQQNRMSKGAEMDISVCSVHQQSGTLRYASINQPLILIENGEAKKLNPTRCVGSKVPVISDDNFSSNVINLTKGSMIYMFSDGFLDQFGGVKGESKRFGLKRLTSLLADNSGFSMTLQREILNESLENWRKSAEEMQTDDMIMVGVKF